MRLVAESGGSVDVRRIRRMARGDELLIGHLSGMPHPNAGVSMAKLAEWLHDGTATIPARPYLLQGLRASMPLIRKQIRLYLSKKLADRTAPELREIGATCVGAVQEFVRGDYYKANIPNSPRTIARKRDGDTPLIDTGALIDSVVYVARGLPIPAHFTAKETIEP